MRVTHILLPVVKHSLKPRNIQRSFRPCPKIIDAHSHTSAWNAAFTAELAMNMYELVL